MERFKNIVAVATGQPGDRLTLQRALALAERNRARVSVVAVSEPIAGAAQLLLGKERVAQFHATRQLELQNALDARLRRLGLKSVPLQLLSGTPAIEVIRFILREGCDLVVKAREEPERGQGIAVTDKKLLRKCPVPVLLLREGRKPGFARILTAVDPEPSQPSRLDLHRNLLRLAASLAEREQATLDVIHVWDTFSASTLQGPRFQLSDDEFRQLVDEERRLRASWLEDLLAPYAALGPRLRPHLVQGHPAEAIIAHARRRKNDLLVMGTVARGGLPGLLIGNTAEAVLDEVACATLTVKPSDFVCPITP